MEIRSKIQAMVVALGLCVVLPGLAIGQTMSYQMTYGGQILDGTGLPLPTAQSSRSLTVNFYHSLTDPTSAAVATLTGISVVLDATGVFSLPLGLNDTQMNAVFSSATQPVWIEVVDTTATANPASANSATTGAVTYPRQQYSAVPYAMKVPVDVQTINFNSAGQLMALTPAASTLVSAINLSNSQISSNNVNFSGGVSANNITGTLGLTNGGTGAATASSARANLGAAASGTNSDITSLTGLTAPIPLANGGTGASTAALARTALGLGSSAMLPTGTSANTILELNASAQIPAVNGSLVTNLSPTAITTGTIGTAGATVNLVGNVAGNLTGNVTGNVSGSAGSAASATLATTALNISGTGVVAPVNGGTGVASLPALQTALGGTAAGSLIQLNATGKIPALDGSLLTNLASNFSSIGTLSTDVGGTLAAPAVQFVGGAASTAVAAAATAVTGASPTNKANTLVIRDGSNNFQGATITASTGFSGSGAALTNLTAANIAAGTAPINITGSAGSVAGGSGVPIGTILPFAGTTPPTGYTLCDGSNVPTTGAMAALFSVIGTAYGSTASGNFNLPDMRGRFMRGVSGTSPIDQDAATRTACAAGGNAGNAVGSCQAQATRVNGLAMAASTVSVSGSVPAQSLTLSGNVPQTAISVSMAAGSAASAGAHTHTVPPGGGPYYVNAGSTYGLPAWNGSATSSSAGAHTHTVTGTSTGNFPQTAISVSGTWAAESVTSTGTFTPPALTGDDETRPYNIYVNYIIRYQ